MPNVPEQICEDTQQKSLAINRETRYHIFVIEKSTPLE